MSAQLLVGIGKPNKSKTNKQISEYIHEQGVIHRDLKAENVLLSEDEKTVKFSSFFTFFNQIIQLKIADFNVSKVTQETVNTAMIGTMENMPPEGIKGGANADISFTWDFWPVGIILQMLCVFRNC